MPSENIRCAPSGRMIGRRRPEAPSRGMPVLETTPHRSPSRGAWSAGHCDGGDVAHWQFWAWASPRPRDAAVGSAGVSDVDHGSAWLADREAVGIGGRRACRAVVAGAGGARVDPRVGLIAMAAAMLLAARSGVNAPASKQVSIGPFDLLLVYSTPTPTLVVAGLVTVLAFVLLVVGLDAWAAKRVTHPARRPAMWWRDRCAPRRRSLGRRDASR